MIVYKGVMICSSCKNTTQGSLDESGRTLYDLGKNEMISISYRLDDNVEVHWKCNNCGATNMTIMEYQK